MIWIYLTGMVICGLVAGYFWKEIDEEGLHGVVIAAAILWPVLAAVGLLIAPFMGPVAIGIWFRNRRK